MANTLLTPSIIAREALALLQEESKVLRHVSRNYDGDFEGRVGDTINVRNRAILNPVDYDMVARTLTLQNITETSIPVVLDTLLDTSVEITSEEWALELADYSEQVLAPIMVGFAETIDSKIYDMLDADIVQTVGVAATTSAPTIAPEANKVLNDNKVPRSNRHGYLNTAYEAAWLSDALFHQADQRGDQGGIVEGDIGRKFGIEWHASSLNTFDDSYVFHPSGFTAVFRTLPTPRGVAANQAAVVNLDGVGLRVVSGYDIGRKADVISFDVLMGVKTLDANRGVKILGIAP